MLYYLNFILITVFLRYQVAFHKFVVSLSVDVTRGAKSLFSVPTEAVIVKGPPSCFFSIAFGIHSQGACTLEKPRDPHNPESRIGKSHPSSTHFITAVFDSALTEVRGQCRSGSVTVPTSASSKLGVSRVQSSTGGLSIVASVHCCQLSLKFCYSRLESFNQAVFLLDLRLELHNHPHDRVEFLIIRLLLLLLLLRLLRRLLHRRFLSCLRVLCNSAPC